MRRVVVSQGSRDILYGETPYGWRLSRDRSKLVIDGDEQRVLAVVRHMYFVERIPMRSVVERLRDMGVVNRRGRPFGLSSVFEMIHRRPSRPPEASAAAKKRARSRA
jgi:site-specific DNA recombinase